MELTLEEKYMFSVLHSQYHALSYSGDFKSLCISSNGIDPISQNILSSASEDMTYWNLKKKHVLSNL